MYRQKYNIVGSQSITNIEKSQQFDKKTDSYLFNKLAQLVPSQFLGDLDIDKLPKEYQKKLLKRAKAKYLTLGYLHKLISLESSLIKSYKSTLECSKILRQEGQKVTSTYCNQRWCLVCNRIRTAKMINGYYDSLNQFKNPYFVTLTFQNCTGIELSNEIKQMLKNISNICTQFRKKKNHLTGIRKLECTWNYQTDMFNPHFHFIIDGYENSKELIFRWGNIYKDRCTPAAQKLQPASKGSIKELFKYFTKLVHSSKDDKDRFVTATSLDTMFQAMKNKRVFQPMGKLKKRIDVSEDIEDVKSEIFEDIDNQLELWLWNNDDWFGVSTNEALTGYKPTSKEKDFINLIKFK